MSGKSTFFPMKIVDTPLSIRHLHVTAARRRVINPVQAPYRSEENRDGEEEGEEERGEEAQA
jgi:hypothetical protein